MKWFLVGVIVFGMIAADVASAAFKPRSRPWYALKGLTVGVAVLLGVFVVFGLI